MSETAYGIPLLLATSVAAGLNGMQPLAAQFDRAVKRYFQVSAALGYALAVPAIVSAPWVLRLLFGAEYSGAGLVAQIHLITIVFVCMTFARGRVLVALGQAKFVMVAALVGCAVNVGLNLILIPVWGLEGAALAAVASHAVAAIGVTLLYRPTRKLGISQLKAMMSPRVPWRD